MTQQALQFSLGLSRPHRNQYLFSDHYLNELLPQDRRWDEALGQAEDFSEWLQSLYDREKAQLASYNEPQLEDNWIRPILKRLGHVYEVQPSIPGLDAGVKRPDYVFFPSDSARMSAVDAQNTIEYAAQALAVGEAKPWDRRLDKKEAGKGPSFDNQNPSYQIDYYIRTTGLDWGILTNGRLWRLVHGDTSQRLQIYYEVDLIQLLGEADAQRMRYFTLFFGQHAFRPDSQGRVFLDAALDASNRYAVALEEDLEKNVYQALEHLVQGFLDLPSNQLGADDLHEIYDNSLYLLYRLLFILYAESRGLLPLKNSDQYRDNYSLEHIKRTFADLRTKPAPMTMTYWGLIKQLFQIINGDNASLNRLLGVPRYNGGLFDPDQHLFLENHAVGDRALFDAVNLLSRRSTAAALEFVDYRTLGVRHLGSIYEGLLEYKPRIAHEPVVAIRDGKGERWIKGSEAPDNARIIDRRDAGQVYLETDRGKRKATGSYYTPQYIVEYIVHNTLGPLLEEATERVKARAKQAKGDAARAAVAQSLVHEVLGLKVLDPAMGSGHFLVEATEYLALALATDPYVETEETPEEDLTHWKRRVVERCIYGVDLNPLAVELAKLSLWLTTVAADRPLSFLDHHLKCGNSLVGARVKDLGWAPPVVLSKKEQKQLAARAPGQMNMFEYLLSQRLPVVMGRILEITEVESDSYDTVQAKEAADRAVRELKAPFQAVANLWTSGYFGHEFSQGDYDEALGLLTKPSKLLALRSVQRGQDIADIGRQAFFHWELAFPEVFYDQHGQRLGQQAGFDAVVGNPPYVSARELSLAGKDDEKAYYSSVYSWAIGAFDLYVVFSERALSLLDRGGNWAFIMPNKFWVSDYGRRMSDELILRHVTRVVDVSQLAVFADASVYPHLVFGSAVRDRDYVEIVSGPQPPSLDGSVEHVSPSETIEAASGRVRVGGSAPTSTLGNTSSIHSGATGFQASELAGCIVEGPVTRTAVALPFIVTGNIDRYAVRKEGVRFMGQRYQFPFCVFDPATITQNKWTLYTGQKIVVAGMVTRLEAALDDEGLALGVGCYAVAELKIPALYVLALLNSKWMTYLYRVRFEAKHLSGGYLAINKGQLEQLPIRRIEPTTPHRQRERMIAKGVAKAQQAIVALATLGTAGSGLSTDRDLLLQAASPALSLVKECLLAKPEQADVVRDLVAHLAQQMGDTHERGHERVESFWLDLEGVAEAAVFDALRNKGKWESTLWRISNAYHPFVDEDSRSTRHLDDSLAWSEDAFKAFVKALVGSVRNLSDLVDVYRKRHPDYLALVKRIEATDWLIDQIVYKLYGLTEDEIAIVEGRAD